MKKMLAALVAILLLFGGFLFWNARKAPETPAVETPAADAPAPDSALVSPAEQVAEEVAPVEIRRLDVEALCALHGADETVLSLAGETVSWREFSELLCATGLDIQSYFEQMAAYYGMAADWDGSIGDDSGLSFAQYAVAETREYFESRRRRSCTACWRKRGT